ncbi:MAG: hypothetical protein KAX24_08800 [Anaerolineae bacterium]|nr:hypothetical protein [Anaerolineae bacterium]
MVTTRTDKHTGISIDIPTELRRRLRLVTAQRDISVRRYVVETLEERLARDWTELVAKEGLVALSARTDPVLAELWDNEKDAAYDRL